MGGTLLHWDVARSSLVQALAQGEALLSAVDHFSRLSRRQRDAEWFDALSAAHSLTAEYREARKWATFLSPAPRAY